MNYEMLVLDLDGTLTNSKKEISDSTRKALIELQKRGKRVVLASGRPINGVQPLADELELSRYGGYILSFNGANITRCHDKEVIYNRTLSPEVIPAVYAITATFPGLDILTYEGENILSGIAPNPYTHREAFINKMPVVEVSDFASYLQFPVNKLLVTGEPAIAEQAMYALKKHFHTLLSIYRSEPFFLEIMPQNIDKAHSLQRLLCSLGLNEDQMICCGDGYNDVSMIEYAGLGVAMENAQSVVKDSADFITRSNDDDGILYVIEKFMK
ncbi:MAG TPA: Cof-type HAD-IIB family hydrolase [Lachnospiraceae bacterium]|jgi:hypothetical protein|uniref:Cof-type HAD-IIB family hydrolase n=1 Tax=Muricomes intestini TaxID=1796634 RepID=UPI000ED9E3A3|nr:Cof-type HAD-IIB family hydrolase [Lachnospiraceae bacterium]